MKARKRALQVNAVLLDDCATAARYSIGVSTARRISNELGAVVRIGRTRRNNITILDRYFGIEREVEQVEEG